MRKILLLLVSILFTNILLAQSPNLIKYQAVIRNGEGEIISNQNITAVINIIKDNPNGDIIFSETHSVSTNKFGLINLQIGSINLIGFESIDWSITNYYIEIIINGNSLGVSQLLSVPYALYANKAQSVEDYSETDPEFNASVAKKISIEDTSYWNNKSDFSGNYSDLTNKPVINDIQRLEENEILALTPTAGQMVYNLTNNIMLLYNGTNWQEVPINCWPQPTAANAGENQNFRDNTIETVLDANTPVTNHGTGTWSIIIGENGIISDINDPKSNFTGDPCEGYVLNWEIETSCGISVDSVRIMFSHTPTSADAGDDYYITNSETSASLNANTPIEGTGTWSVIEGKGGSFTDINNPQTTFSGNGCTEYKLEWLTNTVCSYSSDTVIVTFNHTASESDAGEDQYITNNTITATLAANNPAQGIGEWRIISGDGGSITNINDPASSFSGASCSEYELVWEIATDCESSTDTVLISFMNTPSVASAGDNQTISDGALTITLNGNTPSNGTGEWTILSGSGGSIAEPTNPNTEFTGVLYEQYTLQWEISTECLSNADEMIITTLISDIEGNTYNTVQIGTQLWMAENLRATKFSNGDTIALGDTQDKWMDLNSPGYDVYCYYDNDVNNAETYGCLYNWHVGYDSRNACPTGWHVPSEEDWQTLEIYLGISPEEVGDYGSRGSWDAGGKLKEVGTTHWKEPNVFATDQYGFKALPAGQRAVWGLDMFITELSSWWSSTFVDSHTFYMREINYESGEINRVNRERMTGGSIRCVKD